MDSTGGCSEGDSSEAAAPHPADLPRVVEIAETGDIILDCVFENSKATLKSARRIAPRPVGQPAPAAAALQPRIRVGFRVDLAVLKRQSKYFDRLLGDVRFKEAKTIEAAFEALSLRKVSPASAPAGELPRVRIVDDDEATRLIHREEAFGDMLRILHGRDVVTEAPTLDFAATLAVLADRFDCAAPVSRVLTTGLKLKWPITQRKLAAGEDPRMSRSVENTLRQKIFVSWLLNLPARFQAATRELIMNGSRKWSAFPEQDENGQAEATWWYLPDGIEEELQFRRECILNTIASIPRHFFGMYTSRARQCKLGYDSSAACDSYQLGETVKFLTSKSLFFLVDFSPGSLDAIADSSLLQVDTICATLRQCPGYQIDKYHANCGLRTRMLPILDFIKALLSANSVPLSRLPWKNDRRKTAWLPREGDDEGKGDSTEPFKFTRAMSSDQRLRFEHTLGAERFARDVFTASSWNWSAEDH